MACTPPCGTSILLRAIDSPCCIARWWLGWYGGTSWSISIAISTAFDFLQVTNFAHGLQPHCKALVRQEHRKRLEEDIDGREGDGDHPVRLPEFFEFFGIVFVVRYVSQPSGEPGKATYGDHEHSCNFDHEDESGGHKKDVQGRERPWFGCGGPASHDGHDDDGNSTQNQC